jgi:hypothetical protein
VNNAFRLTTLALFAALTSGCVYINGELVNDDWKREQRDNRQAISQLEIGTPRSAVLDTMGLPADSEAYTDGDEEVRVLFYRTQRRHSDGDTTRDETTPLVFRNDLLIGWGDAVYAELSQRLGAR